MDIKDYSPIIATCLKWILDRFNRPTTKDLSIAIDALRHEIDKQTADNQTHHLERERILMQILDTLQNDYNCTIYDNSIQFNLLPTLTITNPVISVSGDGSPQSVVARQNTVTESSSPGLIFHDVRRKIEEAYQAPLPGEE